MQVELQAGDSGDQWLYIDDGYTSVAFPWSEVEELLMMIQEAMGKADS